MTSKEQAMAELKAAAFKLAAIMGVHDAARQVERVAAEVRNLSWDENRR